MRALSPAIKTLHLGSIHVVKDYEQRHRHTCTEYNFHIPLHSCRICQALEKVYNETSWLAQTIPENHMFFYFFFMLFSEVLGIEPRALHTLGKCFITNQYSRHGSFLKPSHSASFWTTAPIKPELILMYKTNSYKTNFYKERNFQNCQMTDRAAFFLIPVDLSDPILQ